MIRSRFEFRPISGGLYLSLFLLVIPGDEGPSRERPTRWQFQAVMFRGTEDEDASEVLATPPPFHCENSAVRGPRSRRRLQRLHSGLQVDGQFHRRFHAAVATIATRSSGP